MIIGTAALAEKKRAKCRPEANGLPSHSRRPKMDPTSIEPKTQDFSTTKHGMISWTKQQKIRLSANLSTQEFTCQCSYDTCIVQTIDAALITKLQMIRDELKKPLLITSGFRCWKRQVDLSEGGVETAKGQSQHELGKACDFATTDMKKAEELANTYFDAVGVSPRFIHVDLRSDKKRRWTYKA